MSFGPVQAAETFAEACRLNAAHSPDCVALSFLGRTTTYVELDALTNQVAQSLIGAGLRPGERIVYFGRNTDDYFILVLGATKAGVVTVPANARLSPDEAAFIVRDTKAGLIFAEAGFSGRLAAALGPGMPARGIIEIGELQTERSPFRIWFAAASSRAPSVSVSASDVAVQLYTSGTTGKPKGAMLTHRNFFEPQRARTKAGIAWDAWNEDDATLVAMPVGHIGGTRLGLMTLAVGARAIITQEFNPDTVLDLIERDGVTKIFLVPTALRIVLAHPRIGTADLSGLRAIFYGAASMPIDLLKQSREVFACGFVQQYGMTETCGTVTALDTDDHDARPEKLGSVGRAMPGVEIAIRAATGGWLEAGAVGEILVRSVSTMQGYWGLPEATAATIDAEGWLHTGDAGYLDDEGYLHLKDRLKDMIISGGENVYPVEVEQVLCAHPSVAEAAVFGLSHDKWGEAVTAAVVLRAGCSASQQELEAWLRQAIAGFKIPKVFHVVDALPRNGNGKVLKRQLRETFTSATTV